MTQEPRSPGDEPTAEPVKRASRLLPLAVCTAVLLRFWDKFDPDVLYPYLSSDSIAVLWG